MTLPVRELDAIEARIHARGIHGGESGRFMELADELGTSLAIAAEAVVQAVSTVFGALPSRSAVRAVVQLPADMLGEPVVAGAALDALASLGIAPSRLTLQASGAGVFGTDDSTIHPSLVEAGVRFAVMDLGAQTTALRGFFDPWAQEVLLAEELVSRLGQLEVARHLAEAAASVAINLGLAVVGDGVNDELQLELLQAAGCSAAQGPLWGERMTGDELAKWLAAATEI